MKFKSSKKLDSNSTRYSDKTSTRFKTKHLGDNLVESKEDIQYGVHSYELL